MTPMRSYDDVKMVSWVVLWRALRAISISHEISYPLFSFIK
jgi:hypothetical protein